MWSCYIYPSMHPSVHYLCSLFPVQGPGGCYLYVTPNQNPHMTLWPRNTFGKELTSSLFQNFSFCMTWKTLSVFFFILFFASLFFLYLCNTMDSLLILWHFICLHIYFCQEICKLREKTWKKQATIFFWPFFSPVIFFFSDSMQICCSV